MPKDVLVEEDQTVNIIIYYRCKTNVHNIRQYKILSEEEGKDLISKNASGVDSITTVWSIPSWKPNIDLQRRSTFYSPQDGTSKMDWSKYQEYTFHSCLKKWDIQDKDGNPVPVNPENIGKLPTIIANALLDKYDKCLLIEDEERKKS